MAHRGYRPTKSPAFCHKWKRMFVPLSAKFSSHTWHKWTELFMFVYLFILATLAIILPWIFLKNIGIVWIVSVWLYVLSFLSLFLFICTYNKNYKLYLKTLKYLDTLDDSKLISYEINKMYYENKMLNETQWLLYKFWYIYQKDIEWYKKDAVIIGTRKDFSDKNFYYSEIVELVEYL
ncbi:MAG: hypothetical protein Ta2E_03350 [Mycoplasmoidaceae bacterium]|nr:MAG: hypothetical protein Ta2E_03350 [Mycoplasmoidaceae bacterium]